MAYGIIKVDNITFDQGGADQNTTVSGIYRAITSGVTVTGTISGATASFTSGNFVTATFTSTAIIASGTAASPSLSILSDPNTGLYSPGADQLAISTNGTGRLFVAADGTVSRIGNDSTIYSNTGSTGPVGPGISIVNNNVLDNTSAVLALSSINTAGYNSTSWIANIATPEAEGDFGRGGTMIFGRRSGNNNLESFRVTRLGRLGIGTTTPSGTVDIKAAAATAPLIVQGSSSEFARIDSSGRLLVGNSSTTSVAGFNGALQLQGTGFNGASAVLTNVAADNTGSYLLLGKARGGTLGGYTSVNNGDNLGQIRFLGADGTGYVDAAYVGVSCNGVPGTNNMPGRLFFSTNSGTSTVTERMCITPAGLVGIGTSAPGAGLHIATAGQTTSALDTSGSLNLLVSDTGASAGNGGSIVFGFNNGSGRFASIKGQAITGGGNSTGHLTFSTRNATSDATLTERLRITNDGLVGIGTSAPLSTLTVSDSTAANGTATLGNNASFHGKLEYVFSTGEFRISQIGSASLGTTFYTNGSERIRINSSGLVGIGTTSPATTLEVNGDVTIADKIIHAGDTNTAIRFPAADTVSVETVGTERARIDSSGRLLVGTSTDRGGVATGASHTAIFEKSNTEYAQVILATNQNNTNGAYLTLIKSRGTTANSCVIVSSGDEIGWIAFEGADGTNSLAAARITAFVDGTPGTNDMPGRLVFSTTADGAASSTEAMRINNQRELLIGTTTRTANGGVLQVSNGITFPATAVACTDVNTLDDYEEGTFTPTLSSGFSSGPTSYAYQVGRYTRIGRLVHFQIDIQPTGATADASQWKLAGLPFNVSAIPSGAYIVYQASSNTNALDVFLANTGGATIDIFTSAGATRSGNAAGVNINARLTIVGSYIA